MTGMSRLPMMMSGWRALRRTNRRVAVIASPTAKRSRHGAYAAGRHPQAHLAQGPGLTERFGQPVGADSEVSHHAPCVRRTL
jgi:hypothetical protein